MLPVCAPCIPVYRTRSTYLQNDINMHTCVIQTNTDQCGLPLGNRPTEEPCSGNLNLVITGNRVKVILAVKSSTNIQCRVNEEEYMTCECMIFDGCRSTSNSQCHVCL